MRHLIVVTAAFTFFASVFAQAAPAPADTSPAGAPLRIAVVGFVHGHLGGFFRQYQRRPDLQIVGYAEPDKELAARYADQYHLDRGLVFSNLEEMLDKTHPQAVVTYTNTRDHRKVVEACARRRIDVMMEKPLAVSFEDALAMQKAAEAGHIQVIVNYETTWYRSNTAAYELLRSGALGELRKVVVHDGHRGPKEIGVGPEFLAWLSDPQLNGAGALFDFGCYGADLTTWLMDGRRPETVTAVTQQIKPDVYPKVDDEATIVLTYPHTQAILQASWNWPFDRKDMEVYGRTGYAITVGRDEVRVRREGEARERLVTGKPLEPPYDDQIDYFRAVVLDGLKPRGLSALDTNVTVTEILDAARRSASTGKTVRLPAKQ